MSYIIENTEVIYTVFKILIYVQLCLQRQAFFLISSHQKIQ